MSTGKRLCAWSEQRREKWPTRTKPLPGEVQGELQLPSAVRIKMPVPFFIIPGMGIIIKQWQISLTH